MNIDPEVIGRLTELFDADYVEDIEYREIYESILNAWHEIDKALKENKVQTLEFIEFDDLSLVAPETYNETAIQAVNSIGVKNFSGLTKDEVVGLLSSVRPAEGSPHEWQVIPAPDSDASYEYTQTAPNSDFPVSGATAREVFEYWVGVLSIDLDGGERMESDRFDANSPEGLKEIARFISNDLGLPVLENAFREFSADSRELADGLNEIISKILEMSSVEAELESDVLDDIHTIHDSIRERLSQMRGGALSGNEEVVSIDSETIGEVETPKDEGDGTSEADEAETKRIAEDKATKKLIEEKEYTTRDSVRKLKDEDSLRARMLAERSKSDTAEEAIGICDFYDIFRAAGIRGPRDLILDGEGGDGTLINETLLSTLSGLIGAEIDTLKEQALPSAYIRLSDGKPTFEHGFKEHRSAVTDRADDLYAAIKIWDEEVESERKSRSLRGAPTDGMTRLCLGLDLKNGSGKIFESTFMMLKGLVYPTLSLNIVTGLNSRQAGNPDFKPTYGEIFDHHIKGKIKQFFNSKRETKSSISIAESVGTIKNNIIRLLTDGRLDKRTYAGWEAINCPMCDKFIKFSKYSRKVLDKDERMGLNQYSDYEIQNYKYISSEEMETGGIPGATEVIRYEYKAKPGEPKTWSEIMALVESSQSHEHTEGAQRRAEAYAHVKGARSLGRVPRKIGDLRFKCPFPQASSSASSDGTSSQCGLSLSSDLLSNDNQDKLGQPPFPEPLRPEHLQPAPVLEDGVGFLAQLDIAVATGIVAATDKSKFIEHFDRIRLGGWKFSRTFFACPCHDSKLELPTGRDDIRRGAGYLAVPHYGPLDVNASSSGHYSPPTAPDGGGADFEPGRSGYLVCGAAVSLSSFNREPGDAGVSAFLSKSADARHAVNLLIRLGVDPGSLEPFIEAIRRVTAESTQDRIKKIAEILSLAMGMNLDKGYKDMGSINNYDSIRDLGLVCRNGHKFTIAQSIDFGAVHSGYVLDRKASGVWRSILKEDILGKTGSDSRKAFVNAGILSVVKEDSKLELYTDWRAEPMRGRGDSSFIMPSAGAKGERYHLSGGSIEGSRFGHIWNPKNTLKESFDPDKIKVGGDARGKLLVHSQGIKEVSENTEQGEASGRSVTDAAAVAAWQQEGHNQRRSLEGQDLTPMYVRMVGDLITSQLKNIITWRDVGLQLDISGALRSESGYAQRNEASSRKAYEQAESDKALAVRGEISDILHGLDINIKEERLDGVIDILASSIMDKYKDKDPDLLRVMPSYGEDALKKILEGGIRSQLNKTIDLSGLDQVRAILKTLIPDLSEEDYTLSDISLIKGKVSVTGPDGERSSLKGLGARDFKGIIRRRRSEFGGRLVMLALSIRLAEGLVKIYRKYQREDLSPTGYIGYNIGVDLSSVERIMELSYSDLSRIVTIPPVGISDAEYTGAPWQSQMDTCIGDIESGVVGLRAASLSHTYLSRARDMMDAKLPGGDPDSEAAVEYGDVRKYIYGDISTVDVSLHKEDKYAKSADIKPEAFLPVFTSNIAVLTEDQLLQNPRFGKSSGFYARGIMHLLSTSKVNSDLPELDVGLAPSGTAYVLARGITSGDVTTHPPHGVLNPEVTAKIPEQVRSGGWSVFEIPDDERNLYILDQNSMTHLSVAYHPFTKISPRIKATDGSISGGVITNDAIGFSSEDGIPFGKVSYAKNSERTPFPRREGFKSSVGVMVPLMLSLGKVPSLSGSYNAEQNKKVQSEVKSLSGTSYPTRIPIVDVRIPVNIASSGDSMIRDLSWALQRAPMEASDVMIKIDSTYDEMIKTMSLIDEAYRVSHSGTDREIADVRIKLDRMRFSGDIKSSLLDVERVGILKRELRAHFIVRISALHDEYRALPFVTINSGVGSHRVGPEISMAPGSSGGSGAGDQDRYHPVSAPYIPMVDWITANHMVSSPQYGPEFGGHNMWGSGDGGGSIAQVKANFKNLLIEVYGLEYLKRSIDIQLKKENASARAMDFTMDEILTGTGLIERFKDEFPNGASGGKSLLKQIFGYDPDWAVSHGGESGSTSFWRNQKDIRKARIDGEDSFSSTYTSKSMANLEGVIEKIIKKNVKKLKHWSRAPGMLYDIEGSADRDVSVDNIDGKITTSAISPGAYIRVMADIKPEDNEGLSEARSYDSAHRLSISDLNSMVAMYSEYSSKKKGTVAFGRDDAHSIFNFSNRLWKHLTEDMTTMRNKQGEDIKALIDGDIDKTSSDEKIAKIARRKLGLERMMMVARAEELLALFVK
jgi:hypothetical protein